MNRRITKVKAKGPSIEIHLVVMNGKAELDEDTDALRCMRCGAQGPEVSGLIITEKDARRLWNRRSKGNSNAK